MRSPRPATLAGVVCVLLLAAAAAFGGVLGGLALRPAAHRSSAVALSSAQAAISRSATASPSGGATSPPPVTAASVAAALSASLADPELGGQVLGSVVDASTGTVLFDRSSALAAAPASTAKLATAAAVLGLHAPTDTITTTVLAGASPGEVVLVGAGDPTLSSAAAGTPTAYEGAARLADLAAQLKTPVTHVLLDDSLFTGPAVSPAWDPTDVPTSYESAVTALMADGGRDTPTSPVRSAAPDVSAATAFAADLGLPATAVTAGTAPAGAAVLASVHSADYGVLVDQMLQESDDVIAEVLGRQVALALRQPASFAGAVAGIRSELGTLGVDIGAGMLDASGLAATDRLTPAAVTAMLEVITGPAHPVLHELVDDLPVAGWSGTLADRYLSGSSAAAAGLIRAKTGTLTGVSTLAGLVTTAHGRLLLFSFVADQVPAGDAGTAAAETALDDLATNLTLL